MHCITFRALAAQSLFLLLSVNNLALAQDDDSTTMTTLTSTTTVLTITTTVSYSQTTFALITTETAVVEDTTVLSQLSQPMSTSTSTAVTAGATGAMSYSGEAFESSVLNSTNYYRAQHQARALQWDDTLASYAQDYAEKCIWQHSGGQYGENLAEGYPSPTLSIDAWADEEKHYNYEKSHFTERAGHFTQLVWKNTTHVGCGAVQCNSDAENGVKGWYLVCEYSPAGNVAGQFKEEVTKSGEGRDGKPGFGAASSMRSMKVVGALAAAYVLLAMFV